LALAVTIIAARSSWREVGRDLGRVALAAAAVVVAVLLPVLWTGGVHGFVSDVVLEKGQYLHVMNTVLPGFDNAFSILPGHVHVTATKARAVLTAPTTLGTRYFDTFRFVPFFALAIFAWAIWRARDRRRGHMTLCVSFGIAALLAALPSAGPQHVTEVMPLLLAAVASAVALARQGRAPARVGTVMTAVVAVVLIAWLGFGVATISGRAIGGLTGDGGSTSALPHLGSSPVLAADARGTARDVAELRRVTGGRVFIIRADAAYYYLAGNLRNPTPYDFPVLSDFGSAGERGVIRLVEQHRIPYACVRRHDDPPPVDSPDFRPLALNHAVRHDMRLVAHLNICDVYAAR
jgi:hypothetical protein